MFSAYVMFMIVVFALGVFLFSGISALFLTLLLFVLIYFIPSFFIGAIVQKIIDKKPELFYKVKMPIAILLCVFEILFSKTYLRFNPVYRLLLLFPFTNSVLTNGVSDKIDIFSSIIIVVITVFGVVIGTLPNKKEKTITNNK